MWKCFVLAISNLSPPLSTLRILNKHAFETVYLFASDLGINSSYKVTPRNFFKIAVPTNPQLFSTFLNV